MGTEWEAKQYDFGGNYLNEKWIKELGFIYTDMKNMMPEKIDKVIDLGCGVGHIGRELLTTYNNLDYLGIDFSEGMIEKAKKYVPNLNFIVGDLRSPKIHKLYKNNYTYVCMEMLEHVHADLEVLSAIPFGADVLFSVPSYDSQNHVRKFDSIEEVIDRYKVVVDILATKVVYLQPNTQNKNRLYMVKSKRK